MAIKGIERHVLIVSKGKWIYLCNHIKTDYKRTRRMFLSTRIYWRSLLLSVFVGKAFHLHQMRTTQLILITHLKIFYTNPSCVSSERVFHIKSYYFSSKSELILEGNFNQPSIVKKECTHNLKSLKTNFRILRSRKTIPFSWQDFTMRQICRNK